MDTKALRQKILDLAIRGKLVPQDPADEPASVLLQRIRAEKERLIAEGKIKRPKKSKASSSEPHYQNDFQPPFPIPDSWQWVKLEEITSKIGSGSTPRGSNYADKGIPFFRSQNVHNEGIVYEDIKYISPEIHSTMMGTEVMSLDLLLNITGGSIGRCAVIPAGFNKGNVSQHVCIIRPILIDSEYLHAYILSNLFWASMKLTGSGREGLPKYNLEQMYLPLPPLTEQKRIVKAIANFLMMVSDIETNQMEMKDIISGAKSKILELAMQGKLVPQDPADEPAADMLRRVNPKARIISDTPHLRNIPNGWVICVLSDAITSPSAKPYQIFQKEILPKGLIPVISQSSNFIEGYTNCSDKAYPTKDAIVIFGDHTRNVKYFTKPFVVGADGVKLIEWDFDKKFLYYCILYIASKIENKGYSRHFQYLSSYVIGIPPLREQIKIVEQIELIYSILDEIEASLQS